MNTIRMILEELNENYIGDEIIENPSRGDLLNIVKNQNVTISENIIRFVADKNNKKVYIWDAYSELLHDKLMSNYGLNKNSTLIGQAVFDSGKLYILEEDMDKNKDKIASGNYDWLSRYYFDIKFMKSELGV